MTSTLPTIATIDLLWTLRSGASLSEVYAQMPERDDRECWSAFEQYNAAGCSRAYFSQFYELAESVRRTDRIMRYLEGGICAFVETTAKEAGQPICGGAHAANLELTALLVEGFVRMAARGLSYPESTPLDLAAVG